ncbi:ankyrin-2 isoform X1 [Labrus mixtus]|uniref:ankyrin-2 isoform X1 n=1 Tax=Labrus mixtus TaxID=508554 RepID=UPI0029C0691C|nr:ankyrin-2 isoform X1 [Labrus mixtus]
MTNEMPTVSAESEENDMKPSQKEKLHKASKEYTNFDQRSKQLLTETSNAVSDDRVKEPQFQEVYIERKTSSQPSNVKDMSGMLSLLNKNLDDYLQARPLTSPTTEKAMVEEKFEEIIITKDQDKDVCKFVTDKSEEVQVTGTTQETEPVETHSSTSESEGTESEFDGKRGVKETEATLTKEPPMEEKRVEKKASHQSSTKLKDMSGMLSLLNSDLDEYLKDRPVKSRPPEEDVIQEKFEKVTIAKIREPSSEEQMITQWETTQKEAKADLEEETYKLLDEGKLNEITASSVVEIPFKEVTIKRKTQFPQSATEKNMSGMLSLLSCDLDQYLEEKDEIDLEAKKHMQTDIDGVTESSISSEIETPFQEVCIERNTLQQQSTPEKNITGMLTLLSNDLDQYLKVQPVVLPDHPGDGVVHESYKETNMSRDTKRETVTFSSEQEVCSPQEKHPEMESKARRTDLQSGWQTCSPEDDSQESFSTERSKPQTSPSGGTLFYDSIEGTAHITKSYEPLDECMQLPSSSDVLQRPVDLKNLYFADSAKEQCQQDSLENSPIMEDKSSRTSPDSIEPSPTRESPCPDSLEGSPTQTKELKLKMPAKTAVYEDYASQLKACFAYDTSIYRDDSEEDLQENNFEIIYMEGATGDKDSDSAKNDSKICDSENLQMCFRQDSLDTNDSEVDSNNKQITPEEEMFKMAAKIKTFEEMEQETRSKRDTFSDTTVQSEVDDDKDAELDLKFDPETLSKDTSKVASSIEEKADFQAEMKTFQSADNSFYQIKTQGQEPCTENNDYFTSLAESEGEISKDRDAVEDDSSSVAHFSSCVTEHNPIDGTKVESLVEDGPERTEYVVTGYEAEKDFGFSAQVEDEQQVNIFPAEDRVNPVKTQNVTPGYERTSDPFQFQEGKLFEMTRGGAIDMTRRSFDEGEGYAFFHIGEHPVDEVVPDEFVKEDTRSSTFENDTPMTDINLREIPQSSQTQSCDNKIPTPMARTFIKPSSENSASEKPLSKADLGSSIEVQLGSPSAFERLITVQSEAECLESLGLDYLDSTIADLQSDTSTVGHSENLEPSHDSSDSSPDEDEDEDEDEEDQCSVIEMSFVSAAQADMQAHHQDSLPSSAISTSRTIQEEATMSPQASEYDQVKRTSRKSSTLNRRTRSEALIDTSKASIKDSRSYSESSQSSSQNLLSPSKLAALTQERPLAQKITSFSPQSQEIQLSNTAETSFQASLDTDDASSASQKSPDSVIFTYDIPASRSLDSDGTLLPSVQPPSGTEDMFEYRHSWDDTVETQMQRIIDDQTPQCTPVDWQDDADRKEETLAIVADLLGFSWTELARELEFSENDIQLVRTENPNSLQEQSHALLQRWVEREGKHATEDCLIKRLTKINRMDIVHLIQTQMNKSVQEQTSRTYAEIEKTLDHSEVSVALSSVQDDADSPRIIRRVESDRRPPPAVSEEDLSVASLLDIPSWAEPVGNISSESMHCDLLEELEIPHELNPNLWTSEDIITQEPTSYDNSDEQADEMPDLPTQSVTEEKYKDENGHIVVKKVTRKIIRKCVSADGVELEEVSIEGAPQGSLRVAEGDGYSKVVKRTVLKSEGDHTEVTFVECEGFSASKQETAEGGKVRRTERTTVVEGERTMTHQGDPSLASDLPSANDDFKQGPHA